MVTQAGGAINRSIALTLTARDDGSSGRVFGRVSRDLETTQRRLSEVRGEQRRLRSELRGVERGSDAYRELESRIEATRREADRLNDELGEQRRQWGRLTGNAERYGSIARNSMLGVAAAVGGLLFAVDRMGTRMTEALAIEAETGLAVESFQRLQNQLALVNQELDAGDILEFTTRLGDAQQQAAEGAGAQYEAFRRLGFNVNELSARDLPRVLEVLESIPDTARRAFESDELLGGSLAERFRLVLALPDEVRQQAESVTVVTRAQAEAFALAASEVRAFGGELQAAGVQAASSLIPALSSVLDILLPVVEAVGEFASANPVLIQGLAGASLALGSLATAIWAVNAARAAYLALSGPAGWAILGGAAGLLAVGGIAVAIGSARVREEAAEAQENARQQRLLELYDQGGPAAVATEAGARAGVRQGIDDAAAECGQRVLTSILPGVDVAAVGAGAGAGAGAASLPQREVPAALLGGVSGSLGANLEGALTAGLPGVAGAAVIAQSYANAAQRDVDRAAESAANFEAAITGRSGSGGWLANLLGIDLAPRGANVNPTPLPQAQVAPSGVGGVAYDPDAPARLTGGDTNIAIYVQPRADDADSTAAAVAETMRDLDTSGRVSP